MICLQKRRGLTPLIESALDAAINGRSSTVAPGNSALTEFKTIGIQHHKRFVRHKDSTSFFRPFGG